MLSAVAAQSHTIRRPYQIPMSIRMETAVTVLIGSGLGCASAMSTAHLTQSPAECHYAMPDATPIFAEVEVDDPPVLVDHPVPMPYPAEMRRLGIAGQVSVHYVIDSTGTMIPSSLYVDSASQLEFVYAARDLLTASRFKPAVRQQRRVAVCVKQDLNWVIS